MPIRSRAVHPNPNKPLKTFVSALQILRTKAPIISPIIYIIITIDVLLIYLISFYQVKLYKIQTQSEIII